MPDPRDFLRELKRRKVYRVAVAYVVAGLGVLGAAELILDPLGLAGARTLLVVLVILGFPLALVLAWAYELRPEGSAAASPAPKPGAPDTEGVMEEADSDRPPDGISKDPHRRSIAVLPFENMSSEPDSEYFADGVTEELTHALARVANLRVAARTSAFALRGSREDVRDIGRRLGVAHVVEGSVRRVGERLRITAQLIDAGNGYHLWSERFERQLDDVFAIQDEIVAAVLESLLPRLPAGEEAPVLPRTEGIAYDAYLRARHGYRSFLPGRVEKAVGEAELAIRLDPGFAPAHAVLAEILVMQAIGFGSRAPAELMGRAGAAAERALALDPRLPEPHMARGVVLMMYEWRFEEARRELERALELGPSLANAHTWMEFYWTYVEREEERAMGEARRALQLSPLDPANRDRLGTVLYVFGHYDEAEAEFRRMIEEGLDGPLPRLGLADTLMRAGRLDEAVEHAERMLEFGAGSNAILGVAAATLGVAGREERAREMLDRLERLRADGGGSSFWVAAAHAGLGEIDRAFEALDRALDERDSSLIFLSAVPGPTGLKRDPRYPRVLERIGLGHLHLEAAIRLDGG